VTDARPSVKALDPPGEKQAHFVAKKLRIRWVGRVARWQLWTRHAIAGLAGLMRARCMSETHPRVQETPNLGNSEKVKISRRAACS